MTEDGTPQTPAPQQPVASQPRTAFDISEEFGTARKNLPPTKIVAIGVALITAIILVLALIHRPKSFATGSIDELAAVEIPDQNSLMVAINVSIQNHGEKPYKIHDIKADLDAGGNFHDEAAPATDFERYYQVFPVLKEHARPPLMLEATIPPGGSLSGTVIVAFPVTPAAFNGRKSLKVTVFPYAQLVPLVLTK
jgi:hypothetical protein